MKIKSFTNTIIKSTILSSLITNILTFIVLFLVCSNLISRIYNAQYENSVQFISNYINEAIDTENIYTHINNTNPNNSGEKDLILNSTIKQKEELIDGLKIFFLKNNGNLSTKLTVDEYTIYFHHFGDNEVIHSVINFSGDLYIVDIKEFGDYVYFQIFNISKSSIINHLYQINGLLGYKFNNEFLLIDSDYNSETNYNITISSDIDAPGIELYYSNNRQITDNIILFFTILVLTTFRFLVTIFNAKRNVNKIKQPLNDLVKNTEKLAAHEISDKLNRFDYPFNEFKKLAEAFNKVLLSRELSEIKLFRSFEQMESTVHKRTQELISTNEQLTQAIKKAEEGNALKSQFLANISHEIRTPLNCIMGFCDIILTENHSIQVSDQVQQILHESETLLHLINDLLDYSKIDAGKMKIVNSELDIRSLISSLIKSGQIQAGDKNIKLQSEIEDSIPFLIMSDELRLYQVISNIFYNAIKFTPSGSVTIKVDRAKNENETGLLLIVSIIDTGIGIPDDRINSIFNKFEQVDGSLTRKYRGSGLGLTICKTIIELMNGTIDVTSEMNKGSCFKVTIPVQSYIPEEKSPKILPILDESIIHSEGSFILLVEDYPVNQIVAKKHLEMDNHHVITAGNGQEALDRCDEMQFDLILMDLQMPVMDGFKATKQIRGTIGLNRKTPILAMTANAMDTAKQACLETGMNGIITKPIRKKMFLKEVDKWLKIST